MLNDTAIAKIRFSIIDASCYFDLNTSVSCRGITNLCRHIHQRVSFVKIQDTNSFLKINTDTETLWIRHDRNVVGDVEKSHCVSRSSWHSAKRTFMPDSTFWIRLGPSVFSKGGRWYQVLRHFVNIWKPYLDRISRIWLDFDSSFSHLGSDNIWLRAVRFFVWLEGIGAVGWNPMKINNFLSGQMFKNISTVPERLNSFYYVKRKNTLSNSVSEELFETNIGVRESKKGLYRKMVVFTSIEVILNPSGRYQIYLSTVVISLNGTERLF